MATKPILINDTPFTLEPYLLDKVMEPLGVCLVWEPPREGFNYVIGCDPADGVGADRSAIMVNRVGTTEHPDEVVAEWCGNVNPFELPPLLNALGRWYGQPDGTEALMCIEVNRGDVAQSVLIREYNYSNVYVWRWYDKAKNPFSTRLGWVTNVDTRPKLCARGIQWVRERKWRINSPWLVHELATFEYDADKARMSAASGCFDDRVMAAFIALWCSHDWTFDLDRTATIDKEAASEPKPSFQCIDISAEAAEDWVDEGLSYA
jgi:hypothetical protein